MEISLSVLFAHVPVLENKGGNIAHGHLQCPPGQVCVCDPTCLPLIAALSPVRSVSWSENWLSRSCNTKQAGLGRLETDFETDFAAIKMDRKQVLLDTHLAVITLVPVCVAQREVAELPLDINKSPAQAAATKATDMVWVADIWNLLRVNCKAAEEVSKDRSSQKFKLNNGINN